MLGKPSRCRHRARLCPLRGKVRQLMASSDKRKQSLYFPEEMLQEIRHEAERLDRSLSWLLQRAWKLARRDLGAIPGSTDPE